MDELTTERFGPGVPLHESRARPNPIPRPTDAAWLIRARRVVLCGTSDLAVLEHGGPNNTRAAADRRLTAAIRAYARGAA